VSLRRPAKNQIFNGSIKKVFQRILHGWILRKVNSPGQNLKEGEIGNFGLIKQFRNQLLNLIFYSDSKENYGGTGDIYLNSFPKRPLRIFPICRKLGKWKSCGSPVLIRLKTGWRVFLRKYNYSGGAAPQFESIISWILIASTGSFLSVDRLVCGSGLPLTFDGRKMPSGSFHEVGWG